MKNQTACSTLALLICLMVSAFFGGCGGSSQNAKNLEAWREAPKSEVCRSLIGAALDLVGSPYRYGGTGPKSFDCSGLMVYVFSRHGYPLPRRAQDQLKAGRWAPRKELLPGDLVFFKISAKAGWHVGLYIGGDLFVHAPGRGREVEVQSLNNSYFRRRYYTARRIIKECQT